MVFSQEVADMFSNADILNLKPVYETNTIDHITFFNYFVSICPNLYTGRFKPGKHYKNKRRANGKKQYAHHV